MGFYFAELRDIALANVVNGDTGFYYRKICRWYSESFSTPLIEVETMDPTHVLLHYFEDLFVKMSENDRLENMYRILDPNFDENEDKEVDEFVQKIEEQARLKREEKEKAKQKQQSLAQGQPEGKVKHFEEPPPVSKDDGLDTLDSITKA